MQPYCDSGELLQEVLRNLAQQQSRFEEQARVLGDIAEGQTLLKNVLNRQHEVLRAEIRAAHTLPDTGTCTPPKGPCIPPIPMNNTGFDSLGTSVSPQKAGAGPELEAVQEQSSEHDSRAQPGHQDKKKLSVLATRHPSGDGVCRQSTDTLKYVRNQGWLRQFVMSGKFDLAMGLIIWMNMVTLSFQLQINGQRRTVKLGLGQGSNGLESFEPFLDTADYAFILIYWVEFLLRFWAQRCAFFGQITNIFDFLLVLLCTVDLLSAFDLGLSAAPGLSRIARLVRLLRVTRLLKVVRVLSICRELYLLVKTITTSILGLFWGMVLIFQIIFATGLLICSATSHFIEDTSADVKLRVWVHENFGTPTSALWTMFECTFSPKWQTFARPFYEEIHTAYLFFWLFYIVIVNFAIMRIVSAMFIKQTMSVAATEEEKIFAMQGKQMKRFAMILSEIFRNVDEDGDHGITTEQFEAVMARDDVHEYFEKLELEMDEIRMLFKVLSEPEGCANYEEFVSGAIRMRSTVRTVDTIQILHEQMVTRKSLQTLESSFDDLLHRLPSRLGIPPASESSAPALHALGERLASGCEPNEETGDTSEVETRPTGHSEVEEANVPTRAPAPSSPEVGCEEFLEDARRFGHATL